MLNIVARRRARWWWLCSWWKLCALFHWSHQDICESSLHMLYRNLKKIKHLWLILYYIAFKNAWTATRIKYAFCSQQDVLFVLFLVWNNILFCFSVLTSSHQPFALAIFLKYLNFFFFCPENIFCMFFGTIFLFFEQGCFVFNTIFSMNKFKVNFRN